MKPEEVDQLLESGEIVEIDEHGRVFREGEAPRGHNGMKSAALRDPVGDY